MNSFLNPHNSVSLTNLIDITANSVSLLRIDEATDEQAVDNILDIFLSYENISIIRDRIVEIGGGLSYTLKEFVGDITDTQVAGLKSILEYLDSNYRKIDDESIINNYYTFHKKHYIQNIDDSMIIRSYKNITKINKNLYK